MNRDSKVDRSQALENSEPSSFELRPAKSEDIPAMINLRGELFRELARQGSATQPSPAMQAGWQHEAAKILAQQLSDPDHFYIVAIAGAEETLAGWGKATTIHQLPAPGFPSGRMGLISSLVIDSYWRGKGIGGSISSHLLRWLKGQHVEVVDLLASKESEAMFRELGFSEPVSMPLRKLLVENLALEST